MSPQDPLLVLRQAIKSREHMSYENAAGACSDIASATHLVIPPTTKLAKSEPTRLRKPGVSAPSGPQDFFSVEAVYLAWLHRDAPGAEYVKHARESGLTVGFVSVTERKGVVDWLEGRVSGHERILPLVAESTTPPGSPPRSAYAALPTPSKPSADSTTSPSKRRYVVDHADAEAVKRIKLAEIELRDRNTVLRGSKTNNFTSIRQTYADKLKKLKDAGRSGVQPTPAAPTPDAKLLARKAKNNFPIIMISSSPTSLVTMHNVRRFLQESTFETSQDARARATAEGNTKPEDVIPIYRKRTSIDSSGKEIETQAKYFIVDSTEALGKFGSDAWERVVCVMTTGQAWQFRPYKWNEPIQLFHHVKGIYVTWANEPPNAKIKDWNVTELKIDPHRRHVDKSTVAHFWKVLDTWMMANKPSLLKT